MLRARIIPCLLVRDRGLVKTRRFGEDRYVGDPLNAVRIFNEKGVDELIVLDIDATTQGREPDYGLIENMAAECRMPLGYGGGVSTVEQAKRIMALGVEKISLSAAAAARPALVAEIARQVGSQSVVVVLDVKKKMLGGHGVYVHNGAKDTKRDPVSFARELESLGVGEIVINSIDNDGMMKGYDLSIAEDIRRAVSVPITVMGGAGSVEDMKQAVQRLGVVGVGAGSLFVFKGQFRAVLISYPSPAERDDLQAVLK
ncbi:AglZ/HisF2 family acetamidino modification protein [Brevundimonas sp.]|uniref:AglZ/HisF2 family acetamidino modification protein n=1 Tax=Brevundimonas sp. TaxID=1871086 RepID=UPI003F6E88E6